MYQLTWQNKKLFDTQEKIDFQGNHSDLPAIDRVVPLYWEEHCVECAIPSCYSTCPLYKKRKDLKCARFTHGIFPNDRVSGLLDFGADITFERWAKLESYWPKNPRMVTKQNLELENKTIHRIENFAMMVSNIFLLIDPKRMVSRFSGWLIEHWTRYRIENNKKSFTPDSLLIQFYYPSKKPRELQLEISGDNPIYRECIKVEHGWNEKVISYSKINQSFTGIGRIRIWPSDDLPIRLVFTWLDLVSFNKTIPSKKVKCVCWDLDNTLWSGVIGDDGADNILPNYELISLIKEFDNRGILQSIISKNDFELAWSKIQDLGLDHYFLYPAIHWNPKSESIKKISHELNININSFAVVDDSEWERNEIESALPNVRTFDPINFLNHVEDEEFLHPITEITRNRRKMYMTEASRKSLAVDWGSDVNGFLKSCKMEMQIKYPNAEEQIRCLELLQRSNQFNLSGKDYSNTSFDSLIALDNQECLSISLEDKYGKYGIVMVVIIEHSDHHSTIIDFAMSCRVAKKLAEETFFKWCTGYLESLGKEYLRVPLNITGRNNPLIESLSSFMRQEKNQETVSYEISVKENSINNLDVIKIISFL